MYITEIYGYIYLIYKQLIPTPSKKKKKYRKIYVHMSSDKGSGIFVELR